MTTSEAPAPTKRRWLVPTTFVAFAALLIGMKCLCPPTNPAALFPTQATPVAEVRGTPMRAAPAPVPAQVPPPAPVAAVVPPPASEIAPPTQPAPPPVVAPPAPAPAPEPVAVRKPVEPPKPAPVAAKAPEAKPEDPSKVKTITWDDISKYTYVPPDPDADDTAATTLPPKDKPKTDQIPADIRAMAGKRYAIEGYAVPLEYEKGIVTKLILLPAPLACCFAEAPPMNRWMMVSNDAKIEFDYGKYNVIRATGVFDVGEETREGYVVGIYRMKGEKIENVSQ